MKRFLPLFIFMLVIAGKSLQAQKIDSIYFHLYTDSLKKGTYNYINVNGKTNNGQWLPLTPQHIDFTTTAGEFADNCLVIDKDFKGDSITVTAALKSDSRIKKTITIYIKKIESNEKLKTTEEILREMKQPKSKKQ